MGNTGNYRRNFYGFIWHALFLAFAATFIDVNTVLSSFVLNIGGSSVHVGMLTAIYIGLPMITQLLFAGFLAGRSRKKPFLLVGIYLRVLALAGMGYTLSISSSSNSGRMLFMIFLWIGIFAVSGAFAGISYTDLLGKIFVGPRRKNFLIFKQFISASGMLASAIVVRHLVIAFPYPENYTVIFLSASALLFMAAIGFLMIKEDSVDAVNLSGIIAIIKSIPRMLESDKNLLNYICGNQWNFMPDNSHLPLNCRDINRVLWFYFDFYSSFSADFDIIVFFEAYKMQHSLISPSTTGIHIYVAGMDKDIEINADWNRSLGSIYFFKENRFLLHCHRNIGLLPGKYQISGVSYADLRISM